MRPGQRTACDNSVRRALCGTNKQLHFIIHCEPWKRWQYICDHNFGKSRAIII